MIRKLYKDIKLKDGSILPKGLKVDVTPIKDSYSVCTVVSNDIEYKLRYTSIFKAPSLKSLEKMVYDGPAHSVVGCICDPDSYDEKGYPSWLLVLGLI